MTRIFCNTFVLTTPGQVGSRTSAWSRYDPPVTLASRILDTVSRRSVTNYQSYLPLGDVVAIERH